MNLYKYIGKKVKIICEDETFFVKVVGHTSAADNEPDDDGKYGGEYINVVALKPTKYFETGGEFTIYLYEIESIEIIK